MDKDISPPKEILSTDEVAEVIEKDIESYIEITKLIGIFRNKIPENLVILIFILYQNNISKKDIKFLLKKFSYIDLIITKPNQNSHP